MSQEPELTPQQLNRIARAKQHRKEYRWIAGLGTVSWFVLLLFSVRDWLGFGALIVLGLCFWSALSEHPAKRWPDDWPDQFEQLVDRHRSADP